ncbi:hypothetical protein AB0J72_35830 [Dactylosporangium sp. NPDC049742]|uniref:hypothetical protein n=1 Tax=Dactylosporangium sp. NPDC049742 TaxID=3154737 RepID=UPI00342A5837
MSVLLVGANPGLTVERDGGTVAFVSVWRVDWSAHGAGRAIVLWHEGRTTLVTDRPELGRWLADTFNRHFPEVGGLPWPEPALIEAPVAVELDLAAGCTATGGGITVELSGPSGHRLIAVDDFQGTGRNLSTVFARCGHGALTVAGTPVPGTASGFLADAEVWTSAG